MTKYICRKIIVLIHSVIFLGVIYIYYYSIYELFLLTLSTFCGINILSQIILRRD